MLLHKSEWKVRIITDLLNVFEHNIFVLQPFEFIKGRGPGGSVGRIPFWTHFLFRLELCDGVLTIPEIEQCTGRSCLPLALLRLDSSSLPILLA